MPLLRTIALWLLLVGLPVQALAAPGLLCAKAGHHAGGTAPTQAATTHDHSKHDHSKHAHAADAAAAGHSHHGADAMPQHADDDDAAPATLPLSGTCAACSGCCFSGAAVFLTLPDLSGATVQEDAVYVAPLLAQRVSDGLFRPPRNSAA